LTKAAENASAAHAKARDDAGDASVKSTRDVAFRAHAAAAEAHSEASDEHANAGRRLTGRAGERSDEKSSEHYAKAMDHVAEARKLKKEGKVESKTAALPATGDDHPRDDQGRFASK
jgi:hypothetical protein